MIQKYIIHENRYRLLLFFAGWGADETPFRDFHPAESDFMICYDYRTLNFDTSALKGYKEINVVGWSMGVWAASQVLGKLQAENNAANEKELPIVNAIAINGTPYPMDETRGIPPAIYHGTLDGLTGASLNKFLRRMCANGEAYKQFLQITPRRPLDELAEELAEIEKMYTSLPEYRFQWNLAVVGMNDRIIPPTNQLNAWKDNTVRQTEDAHYEAELFQLYLQNLWTNI